MLFVLFCCCFIFSQKLHLFAPHRCLKGLLQWTKEQLGYTEVDVACFQAHSCIPFAPAIFVPPTDILPHNWSRPPQPHWQAGRGQLVGENWARDQRREQAFHISQQWGWGPWVWPQLCRQFHLRSEWGHPLTSHLGLFVQGDVGLQGPLLQSAKKRKKTPKPMCICKGFFFFNWASQFLLNVWPKLKHCVLSVTG